MSLPSHAEPTALSGRIQVAPSILLHTEVLEPQFNYELRHMLPLYLLIEKVQLLEYARMQLLDPADVAAIDAILRQIDGDSLLADPQANMSDIAFALERFVESRLPAAVPGWHVDRSRNDVQACAHLMFGRIQLLNIIEALIVFGQTVVRVASGVTHLTMPGYTHYQAAQVISPGFYLAAISEQVAQSTGRLLALYDAINRCPLGAGAMSGLELPWDRERMAELLGFAEPQRHALVAVASREWTLQIAAELSLLSVALSRFTTDFMHWGSSEYRFIDLPDSLAGISSAMPQKKNFPVLERIRGKTAHIAAYYTDMLLAQRNTPFSNLVEVSKEGSANFLTMCATLHSALRLLTVVVEHVTFREDRLRAACEHEFLGGFTLANYLTLQHRIPYRKAQVIAGSYIVRAMEAGLAPHQFDRTLLETICHEHGYRVMAPADQVEPLFAVEHNLYGKQSLGSTNPAQVETLLAAQAHELAQHGEAYGVRQHRNESAYRSIDTLLSGCADART